MSRCPAAKRNSNRHDILEDARRGGGGCYVRGVQGDSWVEARQVRSSGGVRRLSTTPHGCLVLTSSVRHRVWRGLVIGRVTGGRFFVLLWGVRVCPHVAGSSGLGLVQGLAGQLRGHFGDRPGHPSRVLRLEQESFIGSASRSSFRFRMISGPVATPDQSAELFPDHVLVDLGFGVRAGFWFWGG